MANPFAAVGLHQGNNLVEQNKGVSPKVTGATLGGALATILWTLLLAYSPDLKQTLGDAGVTAITGATGTVFAFLLGYLVPDPLRTATNA
jgi:hypothetical protein